MNFPALRPEDLPSPTNVQAAIRQNERARDLLELVRNAPSCADCVCFREVTEIVEPESSQERILNGDLGDTASAVLVQLVRANMQPETRTRKMCAHPAYSVARMDYTRALVDFLPQFTVQESRAEGTVCGPAGSLFVPAKGPVISSHPETIFDRIIVTLGLLGQAVGAFALAFVVGFVVINSIIWLWGILP